MTEPIPRLALVTFVCMSCMMCTLSITCYFGRLTPQFKPTVPRNDVMAAGERARVRLTPSRSSPVGEMWHQCSATWSAVSRWRHAMRCQPLARVLTEGAGGARTW